MITSEFSVASEIIDDTSSISAMKLPALLERSSPCTSRVRTLSMGKTDAYEAGTKHPMCASTAIRAHVTAYVVLPLEVGGATGVCRTRRMTMAIQNFGNVRANIDAFVTELVFVIILDFLSEEVSSLTSYWILER